MRSVIPGPESVSLIGIARREDSTLLYRDRELDFDLPIWKESILEFQSHPDWISGSGRTGATRGG